MDPIYNCKYVFSQYIRVDVFAFVGVFVLGSVTYFLYKQYSNIWSSIGLPLLVGGGLMNIYERLSTSHGCVLDYFDFFGLFMFNLADLVFSIGFLLVLYGIWITNR